VFGYLAHAHPFLEGNGRAILTIFAELSRLGGFHVEWEAIDKVDFLETLTKELLQLEGRSWITLCFPMFVKVLFLLREPRRDLG
jgi:fido (protein-threonine AMPylation protein)